MENRYATSKLLELERSRCKSSFSNIMHACVHAKSLQRSDSASLGTTVYQDSLSMGFSRQEYWSRLPCPPPEDLPDPGIKPTSHVSSIGKWVLYLQCHLGTPQQYNRTQKKKGVEKISKFSKLSVNREQSGRRVQKHQRSQDTWRNGPRELRGSNHKVLKSRHILYKKDRC